MQAYLICVSIGALFAAGYWSATERLKRLGATLNHTNRVIVSIMGLFLTAASVFLLFSGDVLGVVVGTYLALCVGQCVGYLTVKARS